jgi:hypothetical protein
MFTRWYIKNIFRRTMTGLCAGCLVLSCIVVTEIHAQDRNLFAISSQVINNLEKPLADYDADQVARYVGHTLKGISDPIITKTITFETPAVKIPQDDGIGADNFHFSYVMISHNFHRGEDVNRRAIGGILIFEDVFSRTISMAFDTEYTLKQSGDIIIHSADIRPVNAPIMPVCRLFFVPEKSISPAILKTHDFTALLDHVVNKAVSTDKSHAITRTMKNYYVFAFFMDRLDKDATVRLLVSDTADGAPGTSKPAQGFQDQGWHVTYTRAAFALDGKRETFFKALYTPGSSASTDRRSQEVTSLFTSWVTKPSAYMIRQTQMGLAQLGYDIKTVDGKAGKRTYAAIRQFQKDINVKADGKPSAEVLALLNGYRELTGPTAPEAMSGEEFSSYTGGVLIKKIQTVLIYMGYDPGSVDGQKSKSTIAAIQQFQETNALPVDGKPSEALLKILETAAAKHLLEKKKFPNMISSPEA